MSLFKKKADDLTVGDSLVLTGIVTVVSLGLTILTVPACYLVECAIEKHQESKKAEEQAAEEWIAGKNI